MATPTRLPRYFYKILSSPPPHPLPESLPLSPLDAQDGFIHLSTAAQTAATAARFFGDYLSLWILQIPTSKLGSSGAVTTTDDTTHATTATTTSNTTRQGHGELKWEESRSHGCFAHLYGAGIGREQVERVLEFGRAEEQGGNGGARGWEEVLAGCLEN